MKKALTTFLAAAMAISSITAHAGSFSRGGSSYSRSSSYSSSPSRSMGYTRPSPAPTPPRYTSPSPATAPRPYTSPRYAPVPAARTTVVNNNSGGGFGGGGGGFLSSMAGGFTGSVLGNLISAPHGAHATSVAPTMAQPAQVVSPNTAAAIAAPPPIYVGEQSRSGWSVLWSLIGWLITLALLASVVYGIFWIVRRFLESRQSVEVDDSDDTEAVGDLPFSPVAKFVLIQKAFAARDVSTLRAHLDAGMVEQAIDDLPDEGSEYSLKSIHYVLEGCTQSLISVKFFAHDTSDNSDLAEVWHFRRVGSSWLLAGVQQ